MSTPRRPIIGITSDTNIAAAALAEQPASILGGPRWKYEIQFEYCRQVADAGGVPVMLPFELDCIDDYLNLCDGFMLSGGDDCDVTPFGETLHPQAKIMHPQRQAFDLALLRALDATDHPTLGICLGMQLMSLNAGGKMVQHLGDILPTDGAAAHRKSLHVIEPLTGAEQFAPLHAGLVASSHHQAVADPGRLEVIARSTDRVIEAVRGGDGKRFYIGVQWHPERTPDARLGAGVIRALIEACGT